VGVTAVVLREQLCTAPLHFHGLNQVTGQAKPHIECCTTGIFKTLVLFQNPNGDSATMATEHWLCRWKRLQPVSKLTLLMPPAFSVLHIIFVSLI
jgi:hypothetical protein